MKARVFAVVSKIDMAEAAGCDLAALRENIQRVRPGMRVFELSSKSGAGMDDWLRFVAARASAAGSPSRVSVPGGVDA